jgi:dihydroflavonol-4-reductase
MIIVTGASGHIGNVLVKMLLQEGYEVGVVDLDPVNDLVIKDLDVKFFKGDVRDLDFLTEIFKQAEYVFHIAGIVAIAPGNKELMYSVNVQGTKNIVKACLDSGVRRLVYTSSVHALYEPPRGKSIVEKLGDIEDDFGEYAKTKVLATKEVMKGVEKGLDAVVVYPSGVIGPFDYKSSEMGELMKMYSGGEVPFYIDGEYNFVDVRDVARGIILAWQKGVKGEDYILAGEKITVNELFKVISEFTGIKTPKIKIPIFIAKILAPFALIYYRLSKKVPVFTPYSLKVLESNCEISSEKAKKELGYSYRSIKDSVRDILKWKKKEDVEI